MNQNLSNIHYFGSLACRFLGILLKIITFDTLLFMERALRNDQNVHVHDLCYGHPSQTPYNYNIRDLSHGCYFSKLLSFSTSVT
jgi:hypothetical protein